jgi:protein-tyrosine phosphatase
MTDPFRILVVGVGNISRSPLVERHLRHRLDQVLGDAAGAVEVSSAGARAVSGAIMSIPAALELERMGGTPNGFAARQLTRELMREADLVLTATRALRSRVLEDEPAALRRTFTVREFAGLAQLPLSAGTPQSFVAEAAARRWAVDPDEYDLPEVDGASRRKLREAADRIAGACHAISRAWSELLVPAA